MRLGEYCLEGLTASVVASGSGDIFGGISERVDGMEVGGSLVRGTNEVYERSTTDDLEKFHAKSEEVGREHQ